MSDIKVTAQQSEVGKYWEASNVWVTYRSVNGHDWVRPNGKYIEQQRLEELRSAFYSQLAHLDTTAEPQRAKVGDTVMIRGVHYKVDQVEGDKAVVLNNNGVHFYAMPDEYTIVPEPVPAPEPKTCTGNPKENKWGAGLYTNESGVVVVIVDRLGSSVGFEKPGVFLNSDWDYIGTYHRISTDPAAAVRKCFDAISGKGGE